MQGVANTVTILAKLVHAAAIAEVYTSSRQRRGKKRVEHYGILNIGNRFSQAGSLGLSYITTPRPI